MRKPYIGITDFMNGQQSLEMRHAFQRAGGAALGRQLMVGVMMSYKTLNGLPTKWTGVFPKNEAVWPIFVPDPLTLNTLHYADYDGTDVAASLEKAAAFGGPWMSALQLDMVWPDPEAIQAFHARHPDVRVILQANTNALDGVGNDPDAFLKRLEGYGPAVDDVLLDKSMGKGLGMDAAALRPFAAALAKYRPDLGIAAAGGLGPDTLHLVEPLVAEFPDISLDAQGKLRPSGNALDPVDWAMARTYLERAVAMFEKHAKNPS